MTPMAHVACIRRYGMSSGTADVLSRKLRTDTEPCMASGYPSPELAARALMAIEPVALSI